MSVAAYTSLAEPYLGIAGGCALLFLGGLTITRPMLKLVAFRAPNVIERALDASMEALERYEEYIQKWPGVQWLVPCVCYAGAIVLLARYGR